MDQNAVNAQANLSDLMTALVSESPEFVTRYDRQTGQVVTIEESLLSEVEQGEAPLARDLSDWQRQELALARAIASDDDERFISPPRAFDFHEYRHLERFIGSLADAYAANQLWRAIKRKGAFRRFKNTLHHLGLQDEWYRFRDAEMKKFVINWAEENGVPYFDDTAGMKF